MCCKHQIGFTLAELLIALAILGVIATFTIPKVLNAQADSKFKATAKEAAGIVAEALHQVRLREGITATTTAGTILPYLNYVKQETFGLVDNGQGLGTLNCAGTATCLRMHNGGTLVFWATDAFCGLNTTNALPFFWDPDGTTDSTTNGPGKSLMLFIDADGRLRTKGTILPNTTHGTTGGCFTTNNPDVNNDPPWFSWN